MARLCSFFGCDRRSKDGSYFPLKNPELCSKWVHRSKRLDWAPTKNSYVCGAHFQPEDWVLKGDKKFLKPDALPQAADAKGYTVQGRLRSSRNDARAQRAARRAAAVTHPEESGEKKRKPGALGQEVVHEALNQEENPDDYPSV